MGLFILNNCRVFIGLFIESISPFPISDLIYVRHIIIISYSMSHHDSKSRLLLPQYTMEFSFSYIWNKKKRNCNIFVEIVTGRQMRFYTQRKSGGGGGEGRRRQREGGFQEKCIKKQQESRQGTGGGLHYQILKDVKV